MSSTFDTLCILLVVRVIKCDKDHTHIVYDLSNFCYRIQCILLYQKPKSLVAWVGETWLFFLKVVK